MKQALTYHSVHVAEDPGWQPGTPLRQLHARERRRLKQIAVHQAGHAVIAHALGVLFDKVSIFPEAFESADHLPLASKGVSPDVEIKILWAGAESCRRMSPSLGGPRRDGAPNVVRIRGLLEELAPYFNKRSSVGNALADGVNKRLA